MCIRDSINAFLTLDLEMHAIWFCSMNKWYIWQNLTKPQPDYSRFTRLDAVSYTHLDVYKRQVPGGLFSRFCNHFLNRGAMFIMHPIQVIQAFSFYPR